VCDLGLDLRHEELRVARDEDAAAPLERITGIATRGAQRTTEVEKRPTNVDACLQLVKLLDGVFKISDRIVGLDRKETVRVPKARTGEG